jgi:polyphosphate kinase 2 (PPK2 family)
MFESAELGHTISKQTYARQVPKLRDALLDAQYDLFQNGRFPVILLIGGVDGAGKGETVNLLNEWMDPRHIRTFAFGEPSDEEAERPPMWRFWRALPPKGKIGILFGHAHRADHRPGDGTPAGAVIEEIKCASRVLSDEALVLEFWFHLSRTARKAPQGPGQTRWRVTDTDWERFRATVPK